MIIHDIGTLLKRQITISFTGKNNINIILKFLINHGSQL